VKRPLGLEEVVHQTRTMFHNLQLDHLHMAQNSPWHGIMELKDRITPQGNFFQ
jgi:hypothetical protein